MPEAPELHMASLFVNRCCAGVVFTGAVEKSEVSKNPEVPFSCPAYTICATPRGKEVRLTLTPLPCQGSDRKRAERREPVSVVFRFGMTGYFSFKLCDEMPKHAHLRFYTRQTPPRVLSFVDSRRFGSWDASGAWQAARGPCVLSEYEEFRANVLAHLSERTFDKPVCEVLLNQKYFNGIGNYLRAEILYRSGVPPFVQARKALEGLQTLQSRGDAKVCDGPTGEAGHDLLWQCHTVPMEVVHLGWKGYDPEKKDYSKFVQWFQCYSVEGMNSLRDHNGRTVWFKGDCGPLAPKGSKSQVRKGNKLKDGTAKPATKPVPKRRKRADSEVKVKVEEEKSHKVRTPKNNGTRKGRCAESAVSPRRSARLSKQSSS